MCKYEVTQDIWESVMDNNPSINKGVNLPVENVKWTEVKTFLSRLNTKTGKKYRLPTEAEWEYAAQGGNKSNGYKFSGSNSLNDVAWYMDYRYGVIPSTHSVGSKQPNELGIYDMTGNVWEWCSDWFREYSSDDQINPIGPSTGTYRVSRGGSFYTTYNQCEITYRKYVYPDMEFNNQGGGGFRLVRN